MNAFNPLIWWRYPAFRRADWARRSMLLTWLLLLTNALLAVGVAVLSGNLAEIRSQLLRAELRLQPVQPAWIVEPVEEAGMTRMRVASPRSDAVVLRNGRPVATVPAGRATDVVVPSDSLAPSVWQLASAGEVHSRKWTLPEAQPDDVRQRRQASGVALTFDGGADRNAIDDILATLQRHGVRATFFLTGEFIARYPDDTRRVLQYGHEVGNHTWTHLHLTTFEDNRRHETRADVDRNRLQIELLRTAHLFARTTGEMMAPYWRAPYGETNDEINAWALDLGFQHIGWTAQGRRTMDTLDWVDDPDDPLFVSGEAMAQRIVSLSQDPAFRGGIVLMHVGTRRKVQRVHEHLPDMIEGIEAAGIPLLTVTELTRSRGS